VGLTPLAIRTPVEDTSPLTDSWTATNHHQRAIPGTSTPRFGPAVNDRLGGGDAVLTTAGGDTIPPPRSARTALKHSPAAVVRTASPPPQTIISLRPNRGVKFTGVGALVVFVAVQLS